MRPRLILCDIDGTLVVKYENIRDYTRKIIETCQRNGVLFGLATGRPLNQTKYIIDQYGIKVDILLCSNGCEIYDCNTGEYTKTDYMKPEWIKETFEIMEPFSASPRVVTTEGLEIVPEMDEIVINSSKIGDLTIKVTQNIDDYCVDVPKIMYLVNANEMSEIENYLSHLDNEHFTSFKTQPFLIEFASKKASKANAMLKYCNENNIAIEDVIAFGDTTNDNEMLIKAGVGVCLANGSQDTKDIADYITKYPVQEEGLGHFLEEYVVKPNNWE